MKKNSVIIIIVEVIVIAVIAYVLFGKKETPTVTTTTSSTGGGLGLINGLKGLFSANAAVNATKPTEQQNKEAAAQAAMQVGSMFY